MQIGFKIFYMSGEILQIAQNASERKSMMKLKQLGLTDSAIHAIIGALDPYHDVQMTRCGWPDARGGRSVVVELNREITVPNVRGDGGQIMVHMTPFLEPVPMWFNAGSSTPQSNGLTNIPGNILHLFPGGTEGVGNYGGLMIFNQASTGGFTPTEIADMLSSSSAGYSYQLNPFLPNTDCSYDVSVLNSALSVYEGQVRCIGTAFDVRNVSPDLYKSGSQIMYRLDDSIERNPGCEISGFNSNGVSTVVDYHEYACVNPPPSSVADAKLIPGSLTRLSKEGSYLVGKINQVELLPTQNYSANRILIFDENNIQPQATPRTQDVLFSYTNTGVGDGSAVGVGASYSGEGVNFHAGFFNQCGTIHSGLSQQTQLTVTARWILEIFVDPKNSVLYPLSQPAPSFSPEAIDVLTECFQEMEVGTVVKNAGDGWFANVMKAVDLAAPVLSMIPQTKALGALATGASGLYKNATSFKAPPGNVVGAEGMKYAVQQIAKKEAKAIKKSISEGKFPAPARKHKSKKKKETKQ